jgi:hypothetical protein
MRYPRRKLNYACDVRDTIISESINVNDGTRFHRPGGVHEKGFVPARWVLY